MGFPFHPPHAASGDVQTRVGILRGTVAARFEHVLLVACERGPLGQDILRERLGDERVAGVITHIFLPESLEDRPKSWPQCPREGYDFLVIRLQTVLGEPLFCFFCI